MVDVSSQTLGAKDRESPRDPERIGGDGQRFRGASGTDAENRRCRHFAFVFFFQES